MSNEFEEQQPGVFVRRNTPKFIPLADVGVVMDIAFRLAPTQAMRIIQEITGADPWPLLVERQLQHAKRMQKVLDSLSAGSGQMEQGVQQDAVNDEDPVP